MKQRNFEFIKGSIGEHKVERFILNFGYRVIDTSQIVEYSQRNKKYFCADRLVFGKSNCFWVQVKNKEPRILYPDTGLEKWKFERLKQLQIESGIPVLLLFVDSSNKIYGNWIDRLRITDDHGNVWNSKENAEMIYFWLDDLLPLSKLLKENFF